MTESGEMDMRSALYYPHTEIHTERLLKTSLLLWDRVHVIVPYESYLSHYSVPDHQRAHDILCVNHSPSESSKRLVHTFVEDFATRPQLPDAFFYRNLGECEIPRYEVYPQKLLEETWRLLMESALAGGQLPNQDMPVSEAMGLTLMSLLADCCAGETLARITDRAEAYSSVSRLLADAPVQPHSEAAVLEYLAVRSIGILDTDRIDLRKLIEFREREESTASGHELRNLRHRYLDRTMQQARRLSGVQSETDQRELERQFEDEMTDDLQDLRSELRFDFREVLGKKELITAVIAGVATLASPALGFALPAIVSYTGATVGIGGLVALQSKYARSRREILRSHPMAYLYEAAGGLRW